MAGNIEGNQKAESNTARKTAGGFIAIGNSAKFCGYAQTARKDQPSAKKIKSKKGTGDFLTTGEWLDQYIKQSTNWDDLTKKPKNDLDDKMSDEIAEELI